jgi:hypothetical protein
MSQEVLTVTETYRDDSYSLAHISLRGVNQAVRNLDCKMTYTVRGGYGWMSVEGEMYELTEGVQVTILPGQRYQDAGRLSMEVRSEPPFDPEQVRRAWPLLQFSFEEEMALANLVGSKYEVKGV